MDMDRFLSRPLVRAYICFAACCTIGHAVVFTGFAAFIAIRVWMGLPPVPPEASRGAVLGVPLSAMAVVLVISTWVAVRQYRGRKQRSR
jgi:uncharacterized membrane protein (DUF485 family)